MTDKVLSKEQRILRVLRKVLANIVKDATPAPGMPHTFQEKTFHEIRDLFGQNAEREAELAAEAGRVMNEKPYYTDQPRNSAAVTVHRTPRKKPD
ncbi:MAG: hypothetical protein Q7U85_00840 [Rhodocyclaceae bacterium]|nr:hypothetical protein [Rhodocyclaceae bacterium]